MNTYFTALFSVTALVSSAFALPALAGEVSSYKVEVVNQGDTNTGFNSVYASQQGNNTEVVGRIKGKPKAGHVDVAAYSVTGKLLAETTTGYSPTLVSSRVKKMGGPRFSTEALPVLPSDAVIKVAFHRDGDTSSQPTHLANTAK